MAKTFPITNELILTFSKCYQVPEGKILLVAGLDCEASLKP